jgi:hypothetical protein
VRRLGAGQRHHACRGFCFPREHAMRASRFRTGPKLDFLFGLAFPPNRAVRLNPPVPEIG